MQADAVFNLDVNQLDTVAAWIGALAYTFQIYFDFSGYSDMAIGLCKIMGFKIPDNFSNPYTAKSISDFWRKWHISLGNWMKNYLYIPLGGNKDGGFKLYRNLIFVFLLSGLWHGASWNFIVWGAYHGLFLVMERLFLGDLYTRLGKWITIPLTFIIVVTGWVLFRVENLSSALQIIHKMYSFDFSDGKFAMNNDFLAIFVLACFFSFFTLPRFGKLIQEKVYGEVFSQNGKKLALASSILLYYISLSFISALDFNPFIYFRF